MLADGLGSVRTELVSNTVEAVTTYSPYGNVLSQTGAGGTVYSFTGEQYDNAIGLLYLRARFYSPALRVFQSRDMFSGQPRLPSTLHDFSYVSNNPVNHIDPLGLCIRDPNDPYADYACWLAFYGLIRQHPEALEDIPNLADFPVEQLRNILNVYDQEMFQPTWWPSDDEDFGEKRIYIEGVGIFELGHIVRGYGSGNWFKDEISDAIARGGGPLSESAKSYQRKGFLGFTPERTFELEYCVSSEAVEEQISGIAWGMYMDFERAYEELQGISWDSISSYRPEDLPSDAIGFWVAMNDIARDRIPVILQSLGPVERFYIPFGLVFDFSTEQGIISFPENRTFDPMAANIAYSDMFWGTRLTWQTNPWPAIFQPTPIPSGEGTWMRYDPD
jgi:RHS repeat-associated protein